MWVQKSYTTSWMISNHCDFTFLSFKLLGSIFNSLTVKLKVRWNRWNIGHTQRHAYIFSLTLIFHTTISLHAWYLTSRRKSLCFTHKLTSKSILARKFCIQTINWQKQIAREISNWITICHAVFELKIGDFSRSGTVSPESKSYTSLKTLNVRSSMK